MAVGISCFVLVGSWGTFLVPLFVGQESVFLFAIRWRGVSGSGLRVSMAWLSLADGSRLTCFSSSAISLSLVSGTSSVLWPFGHFGSGWLICSS